MALNIFFSSVRLFFSKWEAALHLIGAWIVIYLVGMLLLLLLDNLQRSSPISLNAVLLIVFFFSVCLGVMSAIVGWIRHLLLGETVSPFHIVNFNWPLLPFFLAMIRLLFVYVAFGLVWLAIFFVSGLISKSWGPFNLIFSIIIGFGGLFLISVLLFRLSIILPVAALGNKMTLIEAFNTTRGYGWILFRLILVYFLVQIILGLLLIILQVSTMGFMNVPFETATPANIAIFVLNMSFGSIYMFSFLFIYTAAISIIYARIHENRSLTPESTVD